MSTNGISLSQFAKELGVTEGAVRKAIKRERVPKEALAYITVGKRRMPVIVNVALAAKCYRLGTQHDKGHQAGRGDPATHELKKAQFASAMYRAKRDQIRFEREAGLVVPRHKMVLAIHKAEQSARNLVSRRFRPALDKVFKILLGAMDRHDDGAQ